MMRKMIFLLNPISGTGSRTRLRDTIHSFATSHHWDYHIHDTDSTGRYTELRDHILREKVTDVIIAGGDGTNRQVIGACRDLPVQFGLIPCGSGNGFARSAHIPIEAHKALQIISHPEIMDVDAFMINEHFCCNLSGIGLDAKVANDFAKAGKRGLATYVKLTWKNFWKAEPYAFILENEGAELRTQAFFISLANSNQFGNNVTIAPKARLNDGKLDVVIVTGMSKFKLIRSLLQQLTRGDIQETLFKEKDIRYLQTSHIRIRNIEKAPLHLDGDPYPTEEILEVSVLPAAFKLMVPPAV